MLGDLRTEMAIFFDNLIKDAGTASVHGRAEESLRFVAIVFDLDDAGIGAGSARRRLANPGMPDLQLAGGLLMRRSRRGKTDREGGRQGNGGNRNLHRHFLQFHRSGMI